MTPDALSMVNLHAKPDGSWSWTAFRKPHSMWRSNTGVTDFWLCLEQLSLCLAEETEAEERAAQAMAQSVVATTASAGSASGGIKGKLAEGGKAKKKAVKPGVEALGVAKVVKRRPRRRQSRGEDT
jgi:hypothetical protein